MYSKVFNFRVQGQDRLLLVKEVGPDTGGVCLLPLPPIDLFYGSLTKLLDLQLTWNILSPLRCELVIQGLSTVMFE